MQNTKPSAGCLNFTSSFSEESLDQLHLKLMKKELLKAKRPLLGLAEPSITARGTRRLHEENPLETDLDKICLRDVETIVNKHSDFIQAQQDARTTKSQLQLPRIAQFDLYHIAEAMPEKRARAAYDDLHSFFFRDQAVEVMLEHCQYFIERQAFIMLMWHTYSPIWKDQNFYQISNQSVADSAIVLDHTTENPFGVAKHQPLARAEQQEIFKRVIRNFDKVLVNDLETVAFREKLDRIAGFANDLKKRNGSAIFRPYHEHSPDGFFWWALDNLSTNPQEAVNLYRQLFHKTRAYLEEQGVNNFLYAYSPDIPYQKAFVDKTAFLEHYRRGMPDLDQIEVLGIDAYLWKQFTDKDQEDYAAIDALPIEEMSISEHHVVLVRSWDRILQMIAWLREAYPNKIVGLTETGWDYNKWGDLTEHPITSFWQKSGVQSIEQMPEHLRPHFICFWRNDSDSSFHPFVGVNDEFSQEVLSICEALDTQIADMPKV